MDRKITVKGVGSLSVKPNFVVISLSLRTDDKKYQNAVEKSTKKIIDIEKNLLKSGFEKGLLKTTDYKVRINYEFPKDRKGSIQKVFSNYECCHDLKIEFDYNAEVLSKIIDVITSCLATPQLDIAFTVKDKEAVNEELLKKAAENARIKAKTLCESVGSQIGQLLTIDYNWHELNVFSQTRFNRFDNTTELPLMAASSVPTVEIEPEEIKLKDTATFVWEIK